MKTVTAGGLPRCHGGCMYLLTVEDGRLVKAVPDPEGPLNQGRGCVKGMSIMEQVYHPDRLTTPLRRVGERGSGKWESVSWDEALDEIAEKMGAIRIPMARRPLPLLGTGGTTCPVLAVWQRTRHAQRHLLRRSYLPGTPEERRRPHRRPLRRGGLLRAGEACRYPGVGGPTRR